jgi:hypothetical protein
MHKRSSGPEGLLGYDGRVRSLSFLFVLACSSERPAPLQEAAPASPPASAPIIAAAPTRYPEAAIEEAQRSNRHACLRLVYKRGCSELRTGSITAHVTLDPAGKPARVEITGNTVKRDPKLVADCVEKDLATWTFAPPGDAPPEFDMTLIFSDAC